MTISDSPLLLNDKILDVTKLKPLADDNLNVAKMKISLIDRVEDTLGKKENAGYLLSLLFQQCFPKSFTFVKSRDCKVKR